MALFGRKALGAPRETAGAIQRDLAMAQKCVTEHAAVEKIEVLLPRDPLVLGDLLQHVIVGTHRQAEAGLELIRQENAGRCGFVVLEATAPSHVGRVLLDNVGRVLLDPAASASGAFPGSDDLERYSFRAEIAKLRQKLRAPDCEPIPTLGECDDFLKARPKDDPLLVDHAGPLTPPGHVHDFPINTADALASGVMQAVCGAIEQTRRRLAGDGPVPKGFLAGGAASDIAPYLTAPVEVVDNLVLEGVLALAEGSTRG